MSAGRIVALLKRKGGSGSSTLAANLGAGVRGAHRRGGGAAIVRSALVLAVLLVG